MKALIEALQQFMFLNRPSKNTGDLSVGERMVMMTLNKHHALENSGLLPSELGLKMGLSRSAVTPLLNSLEEKQYLTRAVNPNDRRQILIVPNPLKPNLHQFRQMQFEQLVDVLTPDEQSCLLALIEKLNESILNPNGLSL